MDKLTWMVNDLIEELMDLDMEPKPERSVMLTSATICTPMLCRQVVRPCFSLIGDHSLISRLKTKGQSGCGGRV